VAQILLVGDDREWTGGLKSILAMDGHRVLVTREPRLWRDEEKASSPEVVVAAVERPEIVLEAPSPGVRGFPPPLLFVERGESSAREPYMEERIVDTIVSPFAAEDLLGRVDALVRVRRVVLRQDGEASRAAPTTQHAGTSALGRLGRRLATVLGTRVPRYDKPPAPYLEVAARVADWSDRRDGFEPGHAGRVTSFAAMIADELDLPDAEAGVLLRAAMLHDIGKVALPAEVLRQKGPLEEQQIRLLRSHADRGAMILRALDRDEAVADAILYHHESVDGSGYHGRRGTAIPLAARILAVSEAYDAMTTSLVRKPLSGEAAMGLMKEKRGRQWDASCVDALARALKPAPRSIALSY
jgi:putative nucleotidyltransferase with HDIG domain